MEKWLDKGPELSELVSERLDRRSSRKDVAVVITTSGNPEVLEEHLGALGKQKFRDFDVLIVYGQRDSFAAGPRWAGILHLREKARGGSSGAFYIGQKAALEEGYRTIILADDDCIPVSDDLMGRLAQGVEEGHKILLPKLDKGERGIRMTRIPHYYGAFGREVFERAGLTYLPLFFGGDDVELFHRMAKSFKVAHSEALVRHPDMVPFYIDASAKRYYYTRGEFEALVLQGSLVRPALFALFHILASCALAGMGRRDVATRMIEGLLDGSSMRFFGKEMPAAAPLRESDAEYEVRMGVAELGLERIVAPNMALHREAWKSFAAVAGGLFRALKKSPSCLGRSVLVSGFGGPSNLLVMLPAKTACMEHEGRIIEVFRDRGVAGIIMGYILLLAAIPLSVPAAAALSMMGALNRMRRGISSSGYGIAGGREKINNRLKA